MSVQTDDSNRKLEVDIKNIQIGEFGEEIHGNSSQCVTVAT